MKKLILIVLLLIAIVSMIAESKIKHYKEVIIKTNVIIPIPCDTLYKCTQINDSTVMVIKRTGKFDTKDLIKFKKL